ncbi:MAG: DUF4097 domain-containing protein [Acidimicrobiia bacterium]
MNTYQFEVSSHPEIDIRVESGRIEIRPGEPEKISVEVDAPADIVTVEQKGGAVVIATDPSRRRLARKVFIVVTAPEGCDATITTATAKVTCQAPLGVVQMKSATSDVDLAEVREADIKTASGDVRIGRVTESLRVASASGDVRLSRCSGRASFNLASGDLRVKEADCALSAATASGDVKLDRFVGPSFSLNSMSGSALVGIPSGTTVDLDVTTLSGRAILPEEADTGQTPPQRHTSIKAKLVSGNLEIVRV